MGLAVANNNEGTTDPPNIRKYVPSDTSSHPRRRVSPAPLLEHQILQCVIPVVCRKTNGEAKISHETQL